MTRTSHPLLRPTARPAAPAAARPGSTADRVRAAHPAPRSARHGAELAMEIRWGGRRPLVAASGELDISGADLLTALLAHVRGTDPGPIEVDLGHVSFIDTHGLVPVLADDVVLVAASPAVARVLRLLDLPVPPPGPVLGSAGRRRRAGPRPGAA